MTKDIETVSLPSRYGPVTVPVTDTIIGRALAKYGEWAQLELDILAHFIKEGNTVLDIGACFGTHSIAFSELVGSSGRVIAFEASPTNFTLLERNCRNIKDVPLQLIQAIVGMGDGARFVSRDNEENRGASRLEKASARDISLDAEAGQISLSIDSLDLSRVDFVKIDVEGMESDVVSGALETLRRCAPFIFFEVNSIQGAIDTLAVMKESQYLYFGLVSGAFNPNNFLGVADDIFGGGSECGILAVPQNRHGEVRDAIRNLGMAPMETADDIALLLLNKPQYAAWDIMRERAARTLKVPAIVASVGGVGQLRREFEALQAEKSAVVQKLAQTDAEKQAVEQKLAQTSVEKRAIEQKLAQTSVEKRAIEQKLAQTSVEKRAIEQKLAQTDAEKQAVEQKLAQTSVEKRAIEQKLAQTSVEKRAIEQKLAQTSVEKRAIEQKLAQTDAEKQAVEQKCNRELAAQQGEINRLNTLFIMAQRLARRAGKFPFSIYFRWKRKYRIILKSLRSGTVLIAEGPALPAPAPSPETAASVAEVEAAPGTEPQPGSFKAESLARETAASVAEAEAAPGTEPHPGGFKAESLARLSMLTPREVVKVADLHYGDEPLLSATAICDALAEQAKSTNSRRVILSFSHDHYATIAGGTQLCVGIEEREARADRFAYLHIHPLAHLASLAPVSVADLPFLRLTMNGAILGICSYIALRDAAKRLREDGTEQFVVIHHLLGHATESISEIIKATGRRHCWFWLHDFFTVCVSPHLLRNNVSFCGAPKSDSAGCGICAFGAAREPHQQRIASFFQENDVHLIAPSDFVADLWRKRAGLRYAALTINPHVRIEWTTTQSGEEPVARPARVAFIGMPVLHKGWPHFHRVVEKYRQDKNYDFLYFGVHPVDLNVPHFVVNVSKDNRSGMIDALREAGVDIVLHISPTPETFSFTTHEALAAGAFVVTNASSGNTARTITRTGRGLVLERESDIDVAFSSGEVLRLAKKAQELRVTEKSKVIFSKMTIPLLCSERM
jgi:FkbM family methyltransferase